MLNFHYYAYIIKQNPRRFAEIFNKLCLQFVSIPHDDIHWQSLFGILKTKTQIFVKSPEISEYREAYLTFLRLGLQISVQTDLATQSRAKACAMMWEFLADGVDSKLLIPTDEECANDFYFIKSWIAENESNSVIMPLKLDDLIFRAAKMELIDWKKEIIDMMPELIFWANENRKYDRFDSFAGLFKYFPVIEKDHLKKVWEENIEAKTGMLTYSSSRPDTQSKVIFF